MGVCCLVLQILTLFPDQTVIFPHPFLDLVSIIHTRFQTRPYYLDEDANKKISLNIFRIGLLLSLSYSFEIETSNMFILFLENHSRFQTKMGEVFTRFQTKTAKKIPFGAKHTYMGYIIEYLPLLRAQPSRER